MQSNNSSGHCRVVHLFRGGKILGKTRVSTLHLKLVNHCKSSLLANSFLVVLVFSAKELCKNVNEERVSVPLELNADILGDNDDRELETLFGTLTFITLFFWAHLRKNLSDKTVHVLFYKLSSLFMCAEVLTRKLQGTLGTCKWYWKGRQWGKETKYEIWASCYSVNSVFTTEMQRFGV